MASSDATQFVLGTDNCTGRALAGAESCTVNVHFHMEELLARMRALIRRAQGLASPLLQCGALALDTRSGRVTLDGQPVALTSHEFRLLAYLMHRPGTVVSRTELTEHLYAQDFDRDSNTIEVFIGRLRRKLPPGAIETVRGMGYRLAPAT